jgi:GMP synthase-like glutamine amidotransferase
MRLLVFQHIECEHPGILRKFLEEDNVQWDAVELDHGEPVPDLEGYDALWVMGGPMDVWDVEENPWLVPEKQAIRRWVKELNKPYLGICLGHQLLADALGGTCGPQNPPEIGVLDVNLNDAGKADPIFANMPATQKCLQWHSVCVAQPPENTTILASSDVCRIQAMRVGTNAWSMQYHVEIETDTVTNWGEVPAYRSALENTLGADGLSTMKSDSDSHMTEFLDSAETLYRNFMRNAAD